MVTPITLKTNCAVMGGISNWDKLYYTKKISCFKYTSSTGTPFYLINNFSSLSDFFLEVILKIANTGSPTWHVDNILLDLSLLIPALLRNSSDIFPQWINILQPTITVDIQNISATNTYCAISTVRAKYPSVLTDYGMEDLDISKKIEI